MSGIIGNIGSTKSGIVNEKSLSDIALTTVVDNPYLNDGSDDTYYDTGTDWTFTTKGNTSKILVVFASRFSWNAGGTGHCKLKFTVGSTADVTAAVEVPNDAGHITLCGYADVTPNTAYELHLYTKKATGSLLTQTSTGFVLEI